LAAEGAVLWIAGGRRAASRRPRPPGDGDAPGVQWRGAGARLVGARRRRHLAVVRRRSAGSTSPALGAAAAALLLLLAAALAWDLSRPPARQVSASVLIAGIESYQARVSPWLPALGVRCRFEPTCSHYARRSRATGPGEVPSAPPGGSCAAGLDGARHADARPENRPHGRALLQ
jgi:hypothetical protein